MPTTTAFEKARHGLQWIIITAFFALLWLPTLDTIFHLDHAPASNENRAPASFPVFDNSTTGIRMFVVGLENYYNDHFGFRKRLVRWNNHWKRELFKESTIPNVITGRDGWLYYSGDGMVENCLGISKFRPDQLQQWRALLESRRDWLARRSIPYLFVVAPNKESVYPEFLPQWMVKSQPLTKLDQFFTYMKTNSTVEILDLRPVLIEAKKKGLVYQKTDTHWNFDGAFVAHKDLISKLSRQLATLTPLPETAFKRTSNPKIGGDLARMLGQEQSLPERDFPTYASLPPLPTLHAVTSPDLLAGKKWNKFMDPVVTDNTNRTGTAVVFRDSFSGFWFPFVGQYFGKVVYFAEENWEPAFIEKEKPAVVVDEMVERYFYTADPMKLKAADNLK